jgi:hypothetical protein
MVTLRRMLLGSTACLVALGALAGCGSGGGAVADEEAAGGVGPATSPPSCTPAVTFSDLENKGTGLYVINAVKSNNGGYTTQTFTVTNDRSATISIEQTVEKSTTETVELAGGLDLSIGEWLKVGASVTRTAIYTATQEIDSTVQQEVSINSGSSVQIPVPPGATGYVLYGVDMLIVHGTLKSAGCGAEPTKVPDTVIVPLGYDYCTLVRGPDIFTDGGSGASSSPDCKIIGYIPSS